MIEQLAIAVCGISSVWLSQDRRAHVQRFACLFGIVAQPFWFYATVRAEQWGIVALCFVYTLGWARGVWNFWLRPGRA